MVKQNPKSAVKVAVGKSFDDLVMKNKRPVFLAFVGLSNQMAEKFESNFAKLAAKYPTAEFIKMDMFKNDYPDLFMPSQHRPTLYFVPADKSSPVEFQEDPTVEKMTKFIETNVKSKNEL